MLPKKKTSSRFEFVSGLADGASAMPAKWSRPVFSFRFYEGGISRLPTRPLLAQHDCTTTIEPNDVERVLTDINADYGNRTLCCRSHGMLLVLAPLASLSLAGQEHGRTIPLPVQA